MNVCFKKNNVDFFSLSLGVFQIITAKKEAGLNKTKESQGGESSIYNKTHSLPSPETPPGVY